MLLFIDSFGHSTDSSGEWRTKYHPSTGIFISPTAANRAGVGRAASILTGEELIFPPLWIEPANATFVVGFAWKWPGNNIDHVVGSDMVQIITYPYKHISLAFNHDMTMSMWRYANTTRTTLLGTTTYKFIGNRWFYLEIKGTISGSGSFELHADEDSKLTFSGNTVNATAPSSQWDRIQIVGSIEGSAAFFVSDLYLCDGDNSDGAGHNTFLGDSTIQYVLPSTDAINPGTQHDFTPSSGSDHGAMVDENLSGYLLSDYGPDGDTTYVHSNTPGATETFKYPEITLVGSIRAMQLVPFVKQTQAGIRTMTATIKQNGSDYDHANEMDIPTEYEYRTFIYPTNPDTGLEWDESEINEAAAERGIKLVT
jgi:hypothetical protein